MKIIRKISPVLLVLIVSFTSFGYDRRVTSDSAHVPLFRTDNTGIQFLLNSSVVAGLQSSASGSSVTVISSGSNPVQAVRNALATWNAVTTANIHFLPLQSTSQSFNSADNMNVIDVGSTASDLSFVGSALGVTVDYYNTVTQTLNGVSVPKGAILDSDIILNPADTFSTDGSTSTDLQSVVTHELGHSLSANHTGVLGATMFQFNAYQPFLSTDDLAFVNSAYPLPSGGAALGTISGTVTAGGTGVPFALLTAFDTSAGVTVGGITNPDGTYSFQVPPGNYQMYAEPLNGVLSINVYLSADYPGLAAGANFQTTMYNGSLSVAANSTVNANIAATAGTSTIVTPVVAVAPVNGGFAGLAFLGGPAVVPSGGSVDLVLAGPGFDGTLTNSNFAIYGQGVTLKPGSVRLDPTFTVNNSPYLRLTLNVAATATPSLASFVVTIGSSTSSFSGALLIVPPTPTTTSQSVVSSASGLGNGSGNGAVSPGGLYTVYDVPGTPNLGPGGSNASLYVQNAPNYNAYGQIDTTLAGVTVTFDGVPAPMFLSWGAQLNVQVPFEVAGKSSTQVVVNYLGSASAPVTVPVLPSQPALFLSCGGTVCAYNQDGTINSAQHPAPVGSILTVYGTGVGVVSYTVLTGQGAPAPPSGFTGNYMYTIGGSAAAAAAYGGWTPTAVGLAQWDVKIPAGVPSGEVAITVQDAGGATSQSGAMIYVQ